MSDLRTFKHTTHISILDGIKTREITDPNKVKALLNSPYLQTTTWTNQEWGYDIELENEREQIEKYYKKLTSCRGKNKSVKCIYTMCVDKIGRTYVKGSISLSPMRRTCRCSISEEYVDIDAVNCHPVIFNQIAKENKEHDFKYLNHYVINRDDCLEDIKTAYDVDRDTAKNLIIRLCYGGEFTSWCQDNDIQPEGEIDWINGLVKELDIIASIVIDLNPHIMVLCKDKRNPKSSALAKFAQDIERKLLEHMFKCLVDMKIIKKVNGYYGCVLCFDGIMVEKANIKMEIPELLNQLKAYILKNTFLTLDFTQKDMDDGYDLTGYMPNPEEIVGVKNDDEAAIKVVQLSEGSLVYCNDILYSYNESNGKWRNDKEGYMDYLRKHQDKLHIIETDSNGRESLSSVSYGTSSAHMKRACPIIKRIVNDEDWSKRTQHSSIGYLLFDEGILDIKNNVLLPFNKNIVFFHSCGFKYNTPYTQEHMNTLNDAHFVNPHIDPNFGIYYKNALARASYGHATDCKTFNILYGLPNSGKGCITTALRKSLGGNVAEINGENLCTSQNDDSERRNGFLVETRYARFIISNELSTAKPLDCQIMKKISGGGDEMTGRGLYQSATSFIPHGTIFMMMNHVPTFNNFDEATKSRARMVRYDYSFVKNPTLPHEKEAVDIKKLYQQDCYKRAFLELIISSYTPEEMELPQCVTELQNEVEKDMDVVFICLGETFEITKNEEDVVLLNVINEFYHSHKRDMPNVTLKDFHQKLLSSGCMKIRCKARNEYRDKTVFTNIKFAYSDEVEIEDEF